MACVGNTQMFQCHILLRHDYGRAHNDNVLYNDTRGHHYDGGVHHARAYVLHRGDVRDFHGRDARDHLRGRGNDILHHFHDNDIRDLHHGHGGGIHNLGHHNVHGRDDGARDDGARAYAQ